MARVPDASGRRCPLLALALMQHRGLVRVLAETSDRKPDARRKPKQANDAAVGEALRSVYQKAVEEQVPDEFLDLLGKLD